MDGTTNYDTRYAKSFRHLTREALPRLDNYRNIMSIQAAYRPTLDELHNATLTAKVSLKLKDSLKPIGPAMGGAATITYRFYKHSICVHRKKCYVKSTKFCWRPLYITLTCLYV